MQRRRFLRGAGAVIAAQSAIDVESVKSSAEADRGAGSTAKRETRVPLHRDSLFDPSIIDTRFDSRSISFENPNGARGAGGKSAFGRKGRPARVLQPGERVVLASINGTGTIRHIWMTLSALPPEMARALRFEVFYEGLSEPSISVPIFDFFGLAHGRTAEYYSTMVSVNEGRGLNSYMPMPFGESIRMEFTNESTRHVALFYQIDYTLDGMMAEECGYLHVTFRRENPTTMRRDFVITEGLKGPGRYLGCAVGVRVLEKGWYGEGEVKIFRDGDRENPTYCGTGLEDYVGSAWGLGQHYGPFAGAPIIVSIPSENAGEALAPSLVSFYRWHVPDPIIFSQELRVTIQQIGIATFEKGQEELYNRFRKTRLQAGHGWLDIVDSDLIALGLYERADDYSAAAFVYCKRPQEVRRFDVGSSVKDISWQASERTAEQLAEEESLERRWVGIRRVLDGLGE
jgi:hypothetical protein